MEFSLEGTWQELLQHELDKDYISTIKETINITIADGIPVYPKERLIFNAFNITPWEEVKVVILGQDPYHNPGEAMGLSFSVPLGVRVPPSLRNIYKELHTDLGHTIPQHGDLTAWAAQGVLLLNAMLTVEHNNAGSHRKIGWQEFTDQVITTLSQKKTGIVFMLWGNFAKSKSALIDDSKHLVLQAAHPSPLARGAYFGSKHFSQANEYLKTQNRSIIDWNIT